MDNTNRRLTLYILKNITTNLHFCRGWYTNTNRPSLKKISESA